MDNPYLNKFSQFHSNRTEELGDGYVSLRTEIDANSEKSYHDVRREWVQRFAWAIPNKEAIERIVEESPIMEIGAGTGYWAKLVSEEGGNIICFDIEPPANDESWYPVEQGDHSKASEYPDRTLFLCWVSYGEDWGVKALRNYTGDTVIVVGEGSGGCTGDKSFHSELAHNWEMVDSVSIPQWMGIRDYLRVYKRL